MASDKYHKIVDRLIERTGINSLDWKEGVYTDSYQVSFPNYSLMLTPVARGNEITDYTVSIRDADGAVIDTFSDVDLGEEYYQKMIELYQNARRRALGVDQALDEILQELDISL